MFVLSLLLVQQFTFPAEARNDSAALAGYLPKLAADVLAGYRDRDSAVYLGNLFRLQTVAGRYAEAEQTLARYVKTLGSSASQEVRAVNALYAAYTAGMRDGSAADVVARELARTIGSLDDVQAAMAIRALAVSPATLQNAVSGELRRQGERTSIPLSDALRLIKAWHTRAALRTLALAAPPIVAADDRRRYLIETNLRVPTPDRGTVCAMVVRPRRVSGALPTLLNFTIYADTLTKLVDARRVAANGYAGVVGFTRGKLCSPDPVEPYEHDGADAAALIEWIARQPWSDKRVGMYGGSYEGFTQWAAVKHMPSALKTIIPSVAVGPGLDVPMEGNIAVNFVYPWPFFAANNKTLDSATYNMFGRWNGLNREWYTSGRPYRDLAKIDGTPNPIFDRWIAHPSYDAYWQRMIPFGAEFARIRIPVLQTVGYFFGGPGAAEYYFREHTKHNPGAEHYLIVGPYDHVPGQRGVVTALGDTVYTFAGYTLDQVALQDLWHLRFQWFDWIFKGAPKPPLLADKVNYEVMGANVWKHAPSIAAMTDRKLRLYFGAERAGLPGVGSNAYRLQSTPPPPGARVSQKVDLGNRSDIDRVLAGGGLVNREIDTVDVLQFVSEPVQQRTELSGLFSGSLDVVVNKKDFDAYIALYELNAKGEYFLLTTWQQRASHMNDLVHRRLLTPGRRHRLVFTSIRLTSRMLEPGSRIVVLIGPIKAPVMQINLGSGKEVSDETVADAGPPLTIDWLAGSYLELPIRNRELGSPQSMHPQAARAIKVSSLFWRLPNLEPPGSRLPAP